MDASSRSDASTSSTAPARLEVLDRAVRRLEAADRQAPRRTAEWLLTDLLGCDRGELYTDPNRTVSPDEAEEFEKLVDRRVEGEPLQHILAHTSFYGLRIQVSPAVMVPRPETEQVVERALAGIEDVEVPRVLDVGTGSGCIALALKHERPDAAVHACDVSPDALEVAHANARHLQLDVHFLEADLRADPDVELLPEGLDLLISNPPYIPDEEADTLPAVVREYDPAVALFAGDDPLFFYRALVDWAHALCASGAAVVFETHADYAEDVAVLLRSEDLVDVHVENDLSGRPRIVRGRRS